MRFVQRLMTALTLLTREGNLYRVDLRLRPDGEQGPIACKLEAFAKYHRESSWTWEHMAMTRARVVAGAAPLGERISAMIHEVLVRPREPDELLEAVADMRGRIRKEHPPAADRWNLKHRPGGLIDAEFIIQYLLLRTPAAVPALGNRVELSAEAAVGRLAAADVLAKGPADTLRQGHGFWSALQAMLRLTLGEDVPDELPKGLQSKLAAVAGVKSFTELETIMTQTSDDISALFRDMIETPAATLDRPPSDGAS
jgi:glutamate-ammonia-ligase adenylyltransferase